MNQVRRAGFAAAALVVSLLPPPGGVPIVSNPARPPELTAQAWILVDIDTGVVLAELNADDVRPMASVTKLMTAIVVMEHSSLDATVRISESSATVGESEVGLVTGEVWTVDALLNALLIRSGNDAAIALAEHVGSSVSGFVDMMNAKAVELGLVDTSFANPHGLDDEGHHTTAREMVVIAEEALKYDPLREIMRTAFISFRPDPSGVARDVANTNKLLGVYPGVTGMKTGFTNKAGRVLVSLHERNGRSLVAVVMGSDDHFADSRALLDWGYSLLTARDRLNAARVPEQGGGGAGAVPLRAREAQRAMATLPLPDGQESVTEFAGSELAQRIEEWLRGVMPESVGGS